MLNFLDVKRRGSLILSKKLVITPILHCIIYCTAVYVDHRTEIRRQKLKTLIASAVAASLTLAPIAAQANTRAVEASVSLAALSVPNPQVGILTPEDEEDDETGAWLWIVGGAALFAGFLILLESGEDEDPFASPGT